MATTKQKRTEAHIKAERRYREKLKESGAGALASIRFKTADETAVYRNIIDNYGHGTKKAILDALKILNALNEKPELFKLILDNASAKTADELSNTVALAEKNS